MISELTDERTSKLKAEWLKPMLGGFLVGYLITFSVSRPHSVDRVIGLYS
jgi:hypothetical protein